MNAQLKPLDARAAWLAERRKGVGGSDATPAATGNAAARAAIRKRRYSEAPAAIVGTDPTNTDEGAPVSAQSIHDALTAATNREALDEAFAPIDLLPEAERAPLQELWAQRAKELAK